MLFISYVSLNAVRLFIIDKRHVYYRTRRGWRVQVRGLHGRCCRGCPPPPIRFLGLLSPNATLCLFLINHCNWQASPPCSKHWCQTPLGQTIEGNVPEYNIQQRQILSCINLIARQQIERRVIRHEQVKIQQVKHSSFVLGDIPRISIKYARRGRT